MKYLWIIVFVIIVNMLEAQEIQYEINSSAANMTTENSRLNWSLGSVFSYDYKNDEIDLLNPWLTNDIFTTPNNTGNFVIYPNPGSGFVNVSVDNYSNLPYKLVVYNINGLKILEKDMISNIEIVPLHDLSKGIYFFEFIKEGSRLGVNKMLIE